MVYPKMNADVKAKWVAALRSGKYEQGIMFLRRRDNKFCCLGVVVEIQGGTWEPDFDHGRFTFNNHAGALPTDFRDGIGLDDEAESTLISMNDEGKSFAEIADWIEEHL